MTPPMMAPATDASADKSVLLSDLCRKMSKIDIGINVNENEGIKHGIKINLPLIFNFLYLSNVNISFKLFQNYIFILYNTSLFSFYIHNFD